MRWIMNGGGSRWPLLPLRVVIGYGFLAHGLAKWARGPAGFAAMLHQLGVPLPYPAAWVVTLVEVAGGIAILAGLWVAVASVPLAASMLVAMFTIHIHFGFSAVNTIGLTPAGPLFGPPGYEINLLYLAGLGVLAFTGPGPWSADEWRSRRHLSREAGA
jgi:putative oxidoreductase